ncbi:helix-turn-helix transcriptional regulator [Leadbettera azotonutricia]|uniref:Phage transcriptional regulator, AlpA n=1 Tax=Leadbettera azotonutricia (strain ATCC BAA-888 / DSM 13862 / ZAS-9) TaxID=545695 RepID=F5YBJ2_LEAAZ|nr:helix-turn-helix domain-containing protein [Leadbettera azotonutricia]AEF82642.1 phage transcriptional regulator, AlpA [Leadbettera azotonutricia ZAS-9]
MEAVQKPLDVDGAAQFTGLKKSYLYKLIHLGKIPCYKPTGGKVFFTQADLETFIFRGRQSADYEIRNGMDTQLTRGVV